MQTGWPGMGRRWDGRCQGARLSSGPGSRPLPMGLGAGHAGIRRDAGQSPACREPRWRIVTEGGVLAGRPG